MTVRSTVVTILGCACLMLAGMGCDRFSPEAKKASHLERGKNYFEKGQYQEALIEYKNVSQIDPKDADAHYQLALIYMKLDGITNLQSAFVELTKTVELDRSNTDAHLKLGEFYLLSNEAKKAREQAEAVLASAPQSADGLMLKGRSLLGEQRYDEGIEELNKALQQSPNNTRLYIDLARAYVLKKDQAAAETILKKGLTVDARSIDLLLALGDYYLMARHVDEAERQYKQALDVDRKNDAVYLKLASFYQVIGKWAEVENAYQQLAAMKPDSEEPHLILGDFYTWFGRQDKALASYQRATEIKPGSVMARNKLINYYLDTGNVREAEGRVKAILDKDKKDLDGRFFDARLRLGKRESDEAIALLQGVMKDEPQFAAAHYFYGMALLQKQQVAQARNAIGEAIKLAPGLIDARVSLAAVYLSEGAADLAVEQAEAALKINPRKVQAAILLADAFFRKGEKLKSKQVYEKLTQGMPTEPIGPYKLGLIARSEKNDTSAMAHFEEALKRRPAAIEPLTEIVAMQVDHGKLAEARNRVMKQIGVVQENALLYNLLGQLWIASKDRAQAETAFKKAIEQDSSLLMAYMNLGALYQTMGRADEAVKEYEAALAKKPSFVQAHVLLGMLYEGKKDVENAIAQYRAALKLHPKLAPAANNLAWILSERGTDLDVALGYAQTARQERPDDPNIADTLGWIYYKKNAYLMAVEFLKEASEKLSRHPVVQFHYGMALYRKGDAASAKKTLETSLKLNPNYEGAEEAKKALADLSH